MSDRKSQTAKILARLIQANGAWVPSYELAGDALQYGARIHTLRHDLKLPIESRTERHGGTVHGFFRLIRGVPSTTGTTPRPKPQPGATQGQLLPGALTYPD